MRIIGGIAAGRRLKVPSGYAVRPTPDIVKQAVFNSLSDRVIGAAVLELFAGSGALGLESLSRGASRVVAAEKVDRHAAMIRLNLQTTDLPADRYELHTQDAFAAIGRLVEAGRRFDLIFADPPFGAKNVGRRSDSLSQALLDDLRLPALLAEGGMFVLGHAHRDTLTVPPGWEDWKQLRHGDSVMRFLRRPRGLTP